jgi:serine/threonine protein phosphatase 1
MSRTFVMGDIHGAHIALQQCLDRCGFDYEHDLLIPLGDYCDGWAYTYEVVETLLRVVNLIPLLGNHDQWLRYWLQTGIHPIDWSQGGKGTAVSYLRNAGKDEGEHRMFYRLSQNGNPVECYEFGDFHFSDIPPAHQAFFKGLRLYYKDDKDRLFVHAGMNKDLTLKENQEQCAADFYWDRKLWNKALSAKGHRMNFAESLSEIFIGHTSTTKWTTAPITTPMNADIIWNLDTGAGWSGKLTIMDVDTHEYWQSDYVTDLYNEPNSRG